MPEGVLAEADRLAGELDRSRSWIVAEAVRRMIDETKTKGAKRANTVKEDLQPPYGGPAEAALVADARWRHMLHDLRLTPEERLRRAEDMVDLWRDVRGDRPRRHQIIGFDTYEDFYRWKTAASAGA